MSQLFIINKEGKANLKDHLLREPENRSKKRGANNDKWEKWKRKLNDYEIIVPPGHDISNMIGKEVSGQLYGGSVQIEKIIF